MRFDAIAVRNFKAISRFDADSLGELVVVAGPNGCGKSALLDAVRLLKSFFGGYQPNEVNQWFGEFQISLDRKRADLARIFRDKALELRIEAQIRLSPPELDFLRQSTRSLWEPIVWHEVLGREVDRASLNAPGLAADLRIHGPRVEERLDELTQQTMAELSTDTFDIWLEIDPDLRIRHQSVLPIELAFRTFEPGLLGIIDYHSSQRAYDRETLGGVNLNLDSQADQRRNYSLYNWQTKYRNIKSELAASYVRALIAERAGERRASDTVEDLNLTLQELFRTFFPDKVFEGPFPGEDGSLEFPVRLTTGERHDINELSSGEKEILYGYLRLRNSAPNHSVILLDEPELHLNPSLLQGLPDFWHRHLGRALDNQLWLVTHSDTLLRHSVGNPNYSVIHMTPATSTTRGENQARPVLADSEIEAATIDLVGDLATYRPQAPVLIFEGGGDTDFDTYLTKRLFPELARRATLVSGGSRRRARDLYDVLDKATQQAGLSQRFWVILDRDSGPEPGGMKGSHVRYWGAYHIENYLLDPSIIRVCINSTLTSPVFSTNDEVLAALRTAAEVIRPRMLVDRLTRVVNNRLVGRIEIGGRARAKLSAADAIRSSIEGSKARFTEEVEALLGGTSLSELAGDINRALEDALESGEWLHEYPGRLILHEFVRHHVEGLSYEAFRNMIIDRMAELSVQPVGMGQILSEVR